MEDKQHDITPLTIKRNRFYGFLIVAIIAAPMIIAYIMFHTGWGVSGHTTNKGQLITPPLPVAGLSLVDQPSALENLYQSDNKSKKWRIIVPVTAGCGQPCQHNLYLSRQVHIRLAEKAYRVERVLLVLENISPEALNDLSRQHPNTRQFETTLSSISTWLAPAKLGDRAEDYFYLVDQKGFAMMRYGQEHTGQDLLDDIKKLLKFTYDK